MSAIVGVQPACPARTAHAVRNRRPGGKQPGAGRKVVFKGPRVKVSVKVTQKAADLIQAERVRLEPKWGTAATDAAAVESLIRKATRTPMDA